MIRRLIICTLLSSAAFSQQSQGWIEESVVDADPARLRGGRIELIESKACDSLPKSFNIYVEVNL